MLKPTKHATTNYKALAPFLQTVNASEEQHVTFTASGYMPLSIEKIYDDGGLPVYSMMHWTTQNGDLMRDPDMTFRVDAAAGTVEPLTFQNDFMGLYQEVYLEDGKRYRPRLRTDLDRFLWQWLKNIKEQKFDPGQKPKTATTPEEPTPEEAPYIYTKFGEEYARQRGLDPRPAGTTACCGGDPLTRGEIAQAWLAKGFIAERASQDNPSTAPDGQVLFPA